VLLSDSTLAQYEVYKTLVSQWERGWGAGGKSDEDLHEVLIMEDSHRKLLPDLVILNEIEGVQWLKIATCERGFSLHTQILTAQRYSKGDSLLACLMMIYLLKRPIVVSEEGGGEISFC
jgi:hypothetical protein